MAATLDSVVTTLNNKADIDLNNVDASKSILVESYRNGSSFYRIYSDGWCVQGSCIDGNDLTAGTYCTIYLLKPYPDTDYNIQKTANNPGAGDANTERYVYNFSINYKTEDKFQIYVNPVSGNPTYWIAFGYLS